jgi:hypothetical protein
MEPVESVASASPAADSRSRGSQNVEESRVEKRPRPSRPVAELGEYNYRPVPVTAVVGLVMALLSSAAVFIWLALPLCVVALVISLLGFWVIRRSKGGYSGSGVALAGIFLSLVFFSSGIGFQVYAYQTEVPPGYRRLSFTTDISDKGMRFENNQMTAPPEVAALEGQKVFLKGFIYQTGQLHGLTAFLFVKDNQDCCFGGKPKLWDRLGVVMQDNQSIDYHPGRVAVAGTFRLNPKFQGDNELEPIYIIEADHFTNRVSDF